jgi:uncharacterized protein YfdQ (DUF2303 family)
MDNSSSLVKRTDAGVVAEIVTEHLKPALLDLRTPDGGSASVLVLPTALEAHSIKEFVDEYRTEPDRRRGTATLFDLDSFIALAKRFMDKDSMLFADPKETAPALLVVFDYHRGGGGKPRFGEHRARYAFPLSNEWTKWTQHNATVMNQQSFAEWIENNLTDIAPSDNIGPGVKAFAAQIGGSFASPSRLLELSHNLSIRVGSKIHHAQNLGTGETQFTYVTEHQDEAGAPLKVPSAFVLAIPVFRGGALYQVPARLRYRVKDGAVVWFYDLYRTDVVFDHALKEACDRAHKEIELPLLYGAPESGA